MVYRVSACICISFPTTYYCGSLIMHVACCMPWKPGTPWSTIFQHTYAHAFTHIKHVNILVIE
ncbi:hypothetical protein U3516DRAFT_749662 [Neocallimastix sp. 'constans']